VIKTAPVGRCCRCQLQLSQFKLPSPLITRVIYHELRYPGCSCSCQSRFETVGKIQVPIDAFGYYLLRLNGSGPPLQSEHIIGSGPPVVVLLHVSSLIADYSVHDEQQLLHLHDLCSRTHWYGTVNPLYRISIISSVHHWNTGSTAGPDDVNLGR
jgi:hypothetical protein